MDEIIEGLKRLVKDSNKLTKLLISYGKLKEKPVENANLLTRKLAEISKVYGELPDFALKQTLEKWITREKTDLEKSKDDLRFDFGEKLKTLFKKDNREIKGQYPKLRVGMYTIVLNFEFGEAVLFFGPEVERVRSKIPLQPEVIYEAIKKQEAELNSSKLEPQEFLNELNRAYKKRLLITGKISGDKLLIIDVLNEFVMMKQSAQFFADPKKENFREYPRVSLCYFLYQLKKSGFSEKGLRLFVANFDATTDKRTAIWIPDNDQGDGTYYSYIAFEKVPVQ